MVFRMRPFLEHTTIVSGRKAHLGTLHGRKSDDADIAEDPAGWLVLRGMRFEWVEPSCLP